MRLLYAVYAQCEITNYTLHHSYHSHYTITQQRRLFVRHHTTKRRGAESANVVN